MRSEAGQQIVPSLKARSVLIACILFAAWLVAYVDRIVIGTAIIPIAKEFHLDSTQKGYILSTFYFSYALMQLGGGMITDRFGPRTALIGCLTVWSIFTAMTGLAWSLPALIAARFLFGLGEGGFSPASASAVATYFPHNARARLQALMGSTSFIGSALGAAAMAALIATVGWRPSFLGLAVVGLTVAVGIFVILPKAGQGSDALPEAPRASWLDVARTPGLWWLGGLWFCACVTWVGLQSWMPSYMVDVRHVSLVDTGLYAVFPGAAGFLGTNIAGRVLDRAGRKWKQAMLLGATIMVPLCVVILPFTMSISALIVVWSLLAAAFGPINATVLSFPVKAAAHEAAGKAMGLINFCGQIAGMITPIAIGAFVKIAGGSYVPAFQFLAVIAALGFIVSLISARLIFQATGSTGDR